MLYRCYANFSAPAESLPLFVREDPEKKVKLLKLMD